MRMSDLMEFLTYGLVIGFCLNVAATAWRVDAMSVVVAIIAMVLAVAWAAYKRVRSIIRRRYRTRSRLEQPPFTGVRPMRDDLH